MFKIVILCIITALSTYLGIIISDRFRRRVIQLKEIQKSIMHLENEILFNNTNLPEALFVIGSKVNSPISEILIKVADKLLKGVSNNVKDAFKEEYLNEKEKLYLLKDDYSIIDDFLQSLGDTNLENQDKVFRLINKRLSLNIVEAEEELKTNSKVYKSLGFCIGSMISIFLI
ncbi:stage III sporulation protein AB [Clostridium sp. LY3-2]|uniref:stage III sporulation protein AB n=1 Tax=Clostridium sp. LY3-2 TaxID=2942482 RepID=UPI002152AA45|nr:stage III sporulation protein AB [Clostridium sp. LY3-2]MCR6515870.1 stage III sporulation protein AB [Clostridium sp. LY3-2]